MKKLLLISLMFSAFSAFAAPVAPEVETVSRILVNNPDVVTKLSKSNITTLTDLKTVTVKPGVTKYVLKYGRYCECLPASAVVTIVEDVTPTYADGLPEYTSNVNITEGR